MNLSYIKPFIRILAIELLVIFIMTTFVYAGQIVRAEFTSTPLPKKNIYLDKPISQSSIRLIFDDNSTKIIPLKYNELFRSGQNIGGYYAGSIIDNKGNRITQWGKTSNKLKIRKGPIYLSSPDGNTLINIKSKNFQESDSIFLVTHFEKNGWVENNEKHITPINSEYDVPMAINLTKLSQNLKNGNLTPEVITNINGNAVQGFWFPCASSLTPWNTHLGSEEYEPNARWFEDKALETVNLYLGKSGKSFKQGGANPYNYGFPIEIKLDSKEKPKVKKRYAMGRASFELGVVMPDERTVYLSDDAKDGIRLMFVADNPKDLSSGNLYAAKWKQTKNFNGGEADLEWIRLGHSNENEIKSYLDNKTAFTDIFELKPSKLGKEQVSNISSFKPTYVYHGYTPKTKSVNSEKNKYLSFDKKIEYLKIKQGMEKAAAFLETRRFAALKGATTEFTKMEGQALNRKDKKLYTAISRAYAGMLKDNNGLRFNNDIHLEGNPDDLLCGLIYESNLESGIKDTEGNLIRSDWVAINMKTLITGKSSVDKTCEENSIANPDNLVFSESFRTLFIAEDTGSRHTRDFLWAYPIDQSKLSRILVAPINSEISGLFVKENLNGFAYILSNIQKSIHPGNFWESMKPENANNYVRDKDLRGIVGYIGGIPLRNN